MTRRKGTPSACECDPCKRKNYVRAINNIPPDANGDFIVEAGLGIAISQTGDNSFSISFDGTYPDKPMIFKGTLGSGGDTPILPDANSDNIGWTYLAIEDGTIPVTYANGDILVSNGYTWVVIPSAANTKLNKITAGSGVRAYVHAGSTQGDKEISESVAASTIPVRKADGTLLGGNPPSGSTDNTLATTNWISQTGDGSPNNLVHRTGTETISGNKSFSGLRVHGTGFYGIVPKKANFLRSDRTANHRSNFRLMEDSNNDAMLTGFVDVQADGTNRFHLAMIIIDSDGTEKEVPLLAVNSDASGNVTYIRVGGRAV
jgi:hypothetical protein